MRIIKILFVIIWMSLIFFLSNEEASVSSKRSDGFINNTIVKIVNKNANNYERKIIYKKYTKPIRKCAHVFMYFMLGILVYICLKDYIDKRVIIYSLIICILYSISDEIHQMFVKGRSGEVLDVLFDSFGSYLGIFLLNIKNLLFKKKML